MEKYFRKENGEVVSLIEHCKDVLGTEPNAEILIGCDSQNSKAWSYYAVAVVFRYGNRGAHYIYTVTKVPKIKDIFIRLFKECELSLEVADFISNNTAYKIAAVELDYNNFKITKSTPLVSATKGWVESKGYKAILKSDEVIACKAADKHSRKRKNKG